VNPAISKKFWARIERKLVEKVDLKIMSNAVVVLKGENDVSAGMYLHTDGCGLVFGKTSQPFNGLVYQPQYITDLVKDVINTSSDTLIDLEMSPSFKDAYIDSILH